MSAFDGTWEAVDEDNFENYLKALGVSGEELDFFLECEEETLTIKHKGTEWTFSDNMDGHKFKETYKEGVEKKTEGLNGKKIKVTLKLESDTKMVEIYNDPKYIMKTTREVNGDEMTETMYVNGVTAIARYRRKSS